MFDRWELMVLGTVALGLILCLANLARLAFGGRKPKPDEHAQHLGI